jgi:phenylpropionate dioxygenase-like ring-hydroxylating dioxygenase large terminal subunit
MAKLSPETRDTWRLRDHAQVLYTLFPGSSLLVQSDHISWIQSEPIDPGKTRLRLSTLAPKAEAEKADHWKRNHEITRTTLDEDFVIGESMQSTLKSGANENMIFGRFEGALDTFNRVVDAHMTPPSPQVVAAE